MAVEWFNVKLGAPIVSVGPHGITFTPAARALLGDPQHVRMGVSADSSKLCVETWQGGDDYSLEFASRVDKNGYARIHQRDIVRFLTSKLKGVDLSVTKRFVARLSENGALEVDLHSGAPGRRRSGPQQRG